MIQPWRGRGIAKALLRRAFAEISTRDRTQVKLRVDAQNPNGAVALYEGVGMTVERRLDIFELGTPESPAGPHPLTFRPPLSRYRDCLWCRHPSQRGYEQPPLGAH